MAHVRNKIKIIKMAQSKIIEAPQNKFLAECIFDSHQMMNLTCKPYLSSFSQYHFLCKASPYSCININNFLIFIFFQKWLSRFCLVSGRNKVTENNSLFVFVFSSFLKAKFFDRSFLIWPKLNWFSALNLFFSVNDVSQKSKFATLKAGKTW